MTAKIATVLSMLMLGCAALSQAATNITQEQASQLVMKAIGSDKRYAAWIKLPKFGLDYFSDPYHPDFYLFEATWDNPHQPPASVVLGHYAVNRRTADVWDIGLCRRFQPWGLKPLQKALRREIGLSEQEYRKLSAAAPCSPN